MQEATKLKKVVEKIRIINVFETEKVIQLEAVIHAGATMLTSGQELIDEPNPKIIRETNLRTQQDTSQINIRCRNCGNVE